MKNKKNEVIIIIPYYHTDLTEMEMIALKQVRKVLKNYDLCFVAPLCLMPVLASEKYPVEYFADTFFENVSTYNHLILTTEFYERFIEYRYILIYQLDAFVFYDRLSYFCDLDYDYIGAPWIYPERGIIEDAVRTAYVGNGGLTLRNVCSCIKLLNEKKEELETFSCNEDFFFSAARGDFKVAPLSIALEFCFETHVRKCFEINDKRLPFGCHAWERYDYPFWKPYMEKEGYDLSNLEIKTGSEDYLLDKNLEEYKYGLLSSMQMIPIILQKLLRKNGLDQKHFTIWGAGRYGKQVIGLFLMIGAAVDYVIDEDELLEGKTVYKVPIVNFKTYQSLNTDNVIVVAVKKYRDNIERILEENHLIKKRDFISILDLADMYYIEVLSNMCRNDETK